MAISATTSILTANDWQYAKDIKPGDWVFNRLGQPVKVTTAQIYRSEDCYRVTFDDYLSIDGDKHIILPVEDPHYRKEAYRYKGKYKRTVKPTPTNIMDLQEAGLKFRGNRATYSVPTTEPIQLPHQPLGIPPFVYGFWFFARLSRRILRVPYEFAEDTYQKFKDSGYQIEKHGSYLGKYEKFTTNPSVWDQLRGQQTHKLPLCYLNGSAEQRLELIRGILSTKPCKKAARAGLFEFKTRKKHISTAFQYLTESLGAKTRISIDKAAGTYDLGVYRQPPFLPQMAKSKPTPHIARRYVMSIERIPAQLCVHIETDDSDGSYLVGEGFIPCQ